MLMETGILPERKGENWVIYSLSKSIVSSTVTKKGYQVRSF